MKDELTVLLVLVIAVLVALVVLLVMWNLHIQRRMNDKNESIIRSIRENIALREELQHRL